MRAKKPAGIKLQYFCQYGDRKKNQPKNKVKPESTTMFKNRSSDRMMTSDSLVDVFDDRYTTNYHQYQQQTYSWSMRMKMFTHG
jgi:hypothetical protein